MLVLKFGSRFWSQQAVQTGLKRVQSLVSAVVAGRYKLFIRFLIGQLGCTGSVLHNDKYLNSC